VFKAHGIRISIPEILAPRLHSLSLLIAQNHLHNKLVPVLAQLLQLYFDCLCHFLAQWVQIVGWAGLFRDEFLVQDGFYDLSAFRGLEFLSVLGLDLVVVCCDRLLFWHRVGFNFKYYNRSKINEVLFCLFCLILSQCIQKFKILYLLIIDSKFKGILFLILNSKLSIKKSSKIPEKS